MVEINIDYIKIILRIRSWLTCSISLIQLLELVIGWVQEPQQTSTQHPATNGVIRGQLVQEGEGHQTEHNLSSQHGHTAGSVRSKVNSASERWESKNGKIHNTWFNENISKCICEKSPLQHLMPQCGIGRFSLIILHYCTSNFLYGGDWGTQLKLLLK